MVTAFGDTMSPPSCEYEPLNLSLSRLTLSPSHDARARVAIAAMINFVMMLSLVKHGGLFVKGREPAHAHAPVDEPAPYCADSVNL